MIRPLFCRIITFADGPRHQEHAAQVDVQHLVPVVVLHPDQQLIPRDAGVVDQHVDPPEALLRRLDEALAVLALGRVGGDAERRSSERLQFLDGRVQPAGVAPRDYHGGAVLCQQPRDRAPDPAGTAGDDGDATCQRLGPRHAAPPGAQRPPGPCRATPDPRPAARGRPSSVRLSSPVSTRPGPTSRKASAPSRASRSTQSVQRTGLATWRTRNGLHVLRRRRQPGVHVADDRELAARSPPRSSSSAGEPVGRRRHERGSGRARSPGSSTLFLPPRSAASAHRALDRGPVPRDDDLPRRVDIGHSDHLALRGLAADLLGRRQVHAQERGHRARAHGHGLLHELAALAHQPHRVGERAARPPPPAPSTRRGCGRPPAAGTMPRSASAAAAATLAVSTRGLRVGGERQLGLRALEAEPRRGRSPARRPPPRQTAGGAWRTSAKRSPHADRLGALPGEEKGDLHRLPAEERRAPGEAAAEGGHQHEIAGLRCAWWPRPPRARRRRTPRRYCRSGRR